MVTNAKLSFQLLIMPPANRYLGFMYSNKPRIGLELGDDQRPGTNNLYVMSMNGIRSFNKDRMGEIRDVTTIGD